MSNVEITSCFPDFFLLNVIQEAELCPIQAKPKAGH
jgi:hypothetical protein